jgi:hypothetical protein
MLGYSELVRGYALRIKELEQENAELKRIIAESQKQEPYGYLHREQGRVMPDFHYKQSSHEGMMPIFASPIIQEGMQLVPIEPTKQMMLDASEIDLEEETPEMYQKYLYEIYKAMLNASKEKQNENI